MSYLAALTATMLLVELDRLGVRVSIKTHRISLRPASRIPAELLEHACESAAELMTMIENPRRRWRMQAEVLVAGHTDDIREDLLHVFDERESIAAIDGGLGDEEAGRLAYEQVLAQSGQDPIRNSTEGDA